MNVKNLFSIKQLVFISCFSSGIAIAEDKVENFFAMSPAELAATTVTIATVRQNRFFNLPQRPVLSPPSKLNPWRY